MTNPYRVFKEIFPDAPLQVGEVLVVTGGTATVVLPGGGKLTVRGEATVGQKVYVRDGVIEAEAPNLTLVTIEV